MTRVKAILSLYNVHDPCLRLDEQFHVTVCELKLIVRTRHVLVGMGLASSYGINKSRLAPAFTHASRHTIASHSSFICGVGNASLQLR